VAKHNFEGKGFWMVVEEEVAPMLTFGADLDPCISDPDDIEVGLQDLDLSFTWDVLDTWLSEKAVKIEEEREGKMPESPSCINEVPPPCNIYLPQGALEPLNRPSPELILAPVDAEGHLGLPLNKALQHMTWHES
jgi:hypothetical protein